MTIGRMGFMMNYCMPRRKLQCTIFNALLVLVFFTFSVKIMLMSSFLKERANMGHIDFLPSRSMLNFKASQVIDEEAEEETVSHVKGQIVPAVWRHPRSDTFYRCIKRAEKNRREGNATNGYILVRSNGGLNQMKTGISDMVAIAKLMNATLVLPYLDHKSFWKDPSGFKDIFDWKHFMKTLEEDIAIVESLPPKYAKIKKARRLAPVSWSKGTYYRGFVANFLKRSKVMEFTRTDSRLANNGVSHPIQKLRCRAMYDALRFSENIQTLGNKLVARLKENGGRYIALHLRFEKDMLAFTGCNHSLTKVETKELQKMRKSVKHWKEKHINGTDRRLSGDCPLTPRETGLFLQGMGYPTSTKLYIAAGNIYGEKGLDDLRRMFPNIYYHSNLATEDELKPFKGRHNQLAALDYVVAFESNVFVYTHDGNMAKAVRGHRIFQGFWKTIRPHKSRLVTLIDRFDDGELQWEEFSRKVKILHRDRDGGPYHREVGESPKLEENFYANPLPGCICEKPWGK